MKKTDMQSGTNLHHRQTMEIHYPEIGVCGLSCRLCPMYVTETASRCEGCKSPARMAVGCPFITCAVKRKGIEVCWECGENATCERWKKHREAGKKHDSFKCYQTLEQDIRSIATNGIEEFERIQKQREHVLKEMLEDFNEGRSKSYYCIAATVVALEELQEALARAKKGSDGMTMKERSTLLHSIIDSIALKRKYHLKLRK